MDKPKLIVIAGCNGSGKSSFSKAIVKNQIIPFDYDQVFSLKYKSLMDFDLRSKMAHNLAFEELEKQIQKSLNIKTDFCYETNFNSDPMHWPLYFKQHGYSIELIYFCLDSIETAKNRVRIRVENGGHFVPDKEIEKRYRSGFENLNKYWHEFDQLHLFETSRYQKEPDHLISLKKRDILAYGKFPDYLSKLVPDIEIFIKNSRS